MEYKCNDTSEEHQQNENNVNPADNDANVNEGDQDNMCANYASENSFTSYEMTREQIDESLSEIVEGLKSKREKDLELADTIKKEIMEQASLSCQMIDQHMQAMHESKGKEIDEEIQKVMANLERVRLMETDLENSKLSLQNLFQDPFFN